MRLPIITRIAALCIAVSCTSAIADDFRFQVGSGFSFSSGKYGAKQSTSVQTTSFTGRVTWKKWKLRFYVPILDIRGPSSGTVIGGSGGGKGANVKTGIGDSSAVLTYTFDDAAMKPFYAVLGARVRLPTGSVKRGLGVGVTDFGVQGEAGATFDDSGVYLDVARRFRGRGHGPDPRLDGWISSVGLWKNATPKWQFGAYLSWSQRITKKLADEEEMGLYARYKITASLAAQAFAATGMTRSSPNADLGITLTYNL
ncbi:MAG TPA: hypothetical protein VHL34_13880 [Rhizomicrobium sp.]|nr:hypothetical protein [Rhizomicrobium sp.]